MFVSFTPNLGAGESGEGIRMFLQSMPVDARSGATFSHLLQNRGIDLITPSASPRPYTLCGGDVMNVWFDRAPHALANGFHERDEDTTGISRSMRAIIDEYITPLSAHYERIFLGGFSMGGGLSLYLLSQPLHSKVCGVFSIGSYLLGHTGLFPRPGDCSNLRTSLPVMMMHGTEI
jgi:predicted esterase